MSTRPLTSISPVASGRHPRATPLRNDTLSQTIYDDVRHRLQDGQWSGKVRLLDYEIAEEYGCTRTPARQALLRLVSEGYLQGTTRGFILPTFTTTDIREIFEIRRLLEPHAAASVTPQLSDKQHTALKAALAQASQAVQSQDAALLTQANVAFRFVWLNSLRNERLLDTIRRFADHAQLIRRVTLADPATQTIVLDGLTRLYQGFANTDAAAVHTAMSEFVEQAERHYMRLAQTGK